MQLQAMRLFVQMENRIKPAVAVGNTITWYTV
jgi:hypothetical protein